MNLITRLSRRQQAVLRRGPLVVQRLMAALNIDVAPDNIAIYPGKQHCGVLAGYGPPMRRGARVAILGPAGTQWILVPLAIAEQCRSRIGTAVTIRRDRNGRYEVKERRDRDRCSVIHRRQVIVDVVAQSEEVEHALKEIVNACAARFEATLRV